MYKVVMLVDVLTQTKEQAEAIEKFFVSAQELMSCENFSLQSSGVEDARNIPEMPDVVLHTKEEAYAVAEKLQEITREYGFVTVSDLYELVGVPPTYIDAKWGWSRFNEPIVAEAKVTQGRVEGWRLTLPVPIPTP